MKKICIKCYSDVFTDLGATAFAGAPGYTSRFDDSLLCEQQLEIYVCDNCLHEHKHAVNVLYTSKPRSVQHRSKWDPTKYKEQYEGEPDWDAAEPPRFPNFWRTK